MKRLKLGNRARASGEFRRRECERIAKSGKCPEGRITAAVSSNCRAAEEQDPRNGRGYKLERGEALLGEILSRHFVTAKYQGHGVWKVSWIGLSEPLQMVLGEKLDHAEQIFWIVCDSLQCENRAQIVELWKRMAIGQGGLDLSSRAELVAV